jgi:hypothetical protein
MPIEEGPGIHDQIANEPILIVQEKINDVSDVPVCGAYPVLLKKFQASQHEYFLPALQIVFVPG